VAGRAGGWAASIQLAALAARSAHAQGKRYLPSGDDDRLLLEDYVMQEVLAHESAELVDVLVATSIVKHIDAALACVLVARPDAADQLTLAEERGLFITRVDPSGFEMHALIREVLQSVLARRAPERLASLHARAAAWTQERGNTTVALEHWLRALRPREALALLAAEMPTLYDSGHESTILRTARGIPEHVALQDPRMLADLAWCHALVDRQRYLGLVDQLSRLVRNDLDLDPAFDARLEVLQSIAVTLRGHWVDGASLARSALQGLGQTWWLDPLGQFCWNMVARDIALSERWDDSGEEARQVLRALSVVPDRRVAFEGTRALAEALAGRPVDALRLVAGARRASPVANMTILQTELLTAEAIASRELGDLGVARALLEEVSQGRIEPAPHCQLLARLELTQARLDEGDPVAAGRAFGLAAELVDTEMPGPGSRSWLARTGTVLALADGDVDGARDWAAQVTDTFWSGVSSARVLLATGERTLAVDALKGAEPRCLRHQVISDLLMFRATEVPAEAEGHLVEAVRLAARLGLVHTVASEGRDVVEGIERLAWQAPRDWMGRLRRVGGPGTEAPTRGSDVPVDALTDRELEVLRLLPSRLTLREIADELFISINTLKFHLKVIYRKLGCTCRAEAAERARAMASLRRSRQPSSTLPR
jgi:LuxR family maltose regulon positive regulatory protein